MARCSLRGLIRSLALAAAVVVVAAAPAQYDYDGSRGGDDNHSDTNNNNAGDDEVAPRRNYITEAGLSVTDNFHPLMRVPMDRESLMIPGMDDEDDQWFSGGGSNTLTLTRRQVAPGTDHIKAIPLQTQYLMQVGIGGTNWSMIPDTGSSDTWLMSSNFSCMDRSHQPQAQAYCNFGPSYKGGFSGGKIVDQHMNITYGGGDSLNGDFGYEEYVVSLFLSSSSYTHPPPSLTHPLTHSYWLVMIIGGPGFPFLVDYNYDDEKTY
jgi:hypothetical protein